MIATTIPTSPPSWVLPPQLATFTQGDRISHPLELERGEATVAEVNRKLAEHKRIRRFRLMEREFSVDRGEWAPTLEALAQADPRRAAPS